MYTVSMAHRLDTIVVVGASLAGLRAEGFAGELTMLDADVRRP